MKGRKFLKNEKGKHGLKSKRELISKWNNYMRKEATKSQSIQSNILYHNNLQSYSIIINTHCHNPQVYKCTTLPSHLKNGYCLNTTGIIIESLKGNTQNEVEGE